MNDRLRRRQPRQQPFDRSVQNYDAAQRSSTAVMNLRHDPGRWTTTTTRLRSRRDLAQGNQQDTQNKHEPWVLQPARPVWR